MAVAVLSIAIVVALVWRRPSREEMILKRFEDEVRRVVPEIHKFYGPSYQDILVEEPTYHVEKTESIVTPYTATIRFETCALPGHRCEWTAYYAYQDGQWVPKATQRHIGWV